MLNKYKYNLSIVIITMNRSNQLYDALKSCLESKLPIDTEFVIVDNASTDNTEKTVIEFFKYSNIPYLYKKLNENKGVGGGRNEGFALASGKYLYFLDDDAIIAPDSKENFFVDTINYLEKNPSVATLTTRITDKMLKCDRNVDTSKNELISGHPTVFKYLGGSHFLRHQSFSMPLYLNVRYANEELMPSIIIVDKGLKNVYFDKVRILHCPRENKWKSGTNLYREILIREFSVGFATKYLLYPTIIHPVLFAAYITRCMVHLRKYKGAFKESNILFNNLISETCVRKVSLKTVWVSIKKFGFRAI